MAKNAGLHNARAERKYEFYTTYEDISAEMIHYRKHFKGKIVYCNCDDPTWSNFWRYFHNNFKSLGLKKLISTHYVYDSDPSYVLEYTGGDDFNMNSGKTITIHGDDKYTAGDFRSEACAKLLNEADIVVTNPPFGLFREYMAQLIKYKKSFIILGNVNAVTYKEIFPLIKDNLLWFGASIHSGDRKFYVPDDYPLNASGCGVDENGKRYIRVKGVRWFTNLDVAYRHDGLWHFHGQFDKTRAHMYYEGFEENYPHYDNYDAIEVGKTKDIPIDYPGVMGVPITWLDKYNPDEFEILGDSRYHDGQSFADDINVVNGKQLYRRILIRNRNPIAKKDDKGY